MITYVCKVCGHVFTEHEMQIVKENYGLPGGYYETFCCCPECGESDFEELYQEVI